MRLPRRYRQDVERIAAEFRISQDIEYDILVKTPFRICVEFDIKLMQNSTFLNNRSLSFVLSTCCIEFCNPHQASAIYGAIYGAMFTTLPRTIVYNR